MRGKPKFVTIVLLATCWLIIQQSSLQNELVEKSVIEGCWRILEILEINFARTVA